MIPEMKFAYLSWEAIATMLAVAAATFVGLRQISLSAKLQNLQNLTLKEALFERRIAVYDATREMLRELIETARFPEKSFPYFVDQIDRAKLLFPRPVYERLRVLQSEMADFGYVIDTMTSNYQSSGSYGEAQVDEKWSTLNRMAVLHGKLDEIFGDEIKLTL